MSTKSEKIEVVAKQIKRAEFRLNEISEWAAENFGNAINAYASSYFELQRYLKHLKSLHSVLDTEVEEPNTNEILTGMIDSEISYITSEIFSVRTDPCGQLESKGYVQLVRKGGTLETLKDLLELN
jgi:hypothetical protein